MASAAELIFRVNQGTAILPIECPLTHSPSRQFYFPSECCRACHITLDFETVVDRINRIGSGTGIFTRALLAHPEWTSSVGQLKAIEPSRGMRDVFSKTVTDDRVTIAEGSFDATNIQDGWADIIIIAQVSFHHHIIGDFKFECICTRRLFTGVQITTVLPQNSVASSSRKALLRLFGI
jgi:hypothetical protein